MTVTGSGYEPGEVVLLRIDSRGGVLGSAVTDENGAFEVEAEIRRNVQPGDYELVGTSRPSGTVASTPLEVLAR